MSGATNRKYLVIGGGGFLGRHLVEKLLSLGQSVSVFDLRQTFKDQRVTFHVGDLCNKEQVLEALDGVDCVFHCATPSPLSNDRKLFHKVNCEGTKVILEACREKGVSRLVLTSSASVVYEGRDIRGGEETLPYARKPLDHYTATKIIQEKMVLEASGDTLLTAAVRPHGIFGPCDPHMLPTTARLAKAGKTKYIIGDGSNLVDFTYIDNVVHGHILAAQTLSTHTAGKAYNITNDEPLPFWTFMTRLCTGLSYPAPSTHLPYWLVYFIALILQLFTLILSPILTIRPTFTPMTVALAGTFHYYSCERAKRELGYRPLVNMDDGLERTLESFPELRCPNATPARIKKAD